MRHTHGSALVLATLAAAPLPAQSTGFWEPRPALAIARQEVGAALLGTRVYVTGGLGLGGIELSSVEAYDPATATWNRIADLPAALHHHGCAAWNGRLYTVGGYSGGFVPTASVRAYDAGTNQWVDLAPLPRARGALVAVEIGGKIYAVGGVAAGGVVVGELSAYDPTANRWTTLAPMPTPREHLAAAAIGGRLYVAGGRVGGRLLQQLEVYDPATNAWSTLPAMPTARGGTGAGVLRGRLIVVGGEGPGGNFPQAEEYDPLTNRWRVLAPMSVPLHGIYPVALGEDLFVAGGGLVPGYGAATTVIALRYLPDGVTRIGLSTPLCNGPIEAYVARRPRSGEPLFALLQAPAAPPFSPGVLLAGARGSSAGTLVFQARIHVDLAFPVLPIPVNADANGAHRMPVSLAGVPAGTRVVFQYAWPAPPGCPGSGPLGASDALEVVVN